MPVDTALRNEKPVPEQNVISVDQLIALLGKRQGPQAARKALKKAVGAAAKAR